MHLLRRMQQLSNCRRLQAVHDVQRHSCADIKKNVASKIKQSRRGLLANKQWRCRALRASMKVYRSIRCEGSEDDARILLPPNSMGRQFSSSSCFPSTLDCKWFGFRNDTVLPVSVRETLVLRLRLRFGFGRARRTHYNVLDCVCVAACVF